MRRFWILTATVAMVLVATALPVAVAAASGDYEITDLGTFGTSGAMARDINDRGVIVGSASTGTQGHAVMWTR